MRRKKGFFTFLFALFVLAGLMLIRPVPVKAAPKISMKGMELEVGQTKKLKIKGAAGPVKWSSTKRSIARVNKNGKVKGISEGLVTIKAKVGKRKLTCDVVVYKSSVVLDQNSTSVWVDEEKTLTASVSPKGRILSWSSEDQKIATVKNGKIKGVSPGTTYVTAWSKRAYGRCKVTVLKEGIYLDQSELDLYIGDTVTLKASTLPANMNVKWSTDNLNVAVVNEGTIRAISEGTATITAKAEGFTATCTVNVDAGSVTLGDNSLDICIGESYQLTAITLPADAKLTWTSSRTEIATVSDGLVTGIKAGNATITASIGDRSASCVVYVSKGDITIDPESLVLEIGETRALEITKTPEDGKVTYETSDNKVATVSDGKVTAIGPGTATISATCAGVTATCKVEVKDYEVTIDQGAVEIMVGSSETLTVTTKPADSPVKWVSSDEEVAAVDGVGKVTGISVGTAEITAVCGGVESAPCIVTISRYEVYIDKTLDLLIGGSSTLKATTIPTNMKVTWSSDKESVATVDSAGKVEAKAEGTANIYATIKTALGNEVKSEACKVTVRDLKVEITPATLELIVEEESDALTVTSDIPGEAITWKSDNEKVATVDKNGKVTAVSEGTATISATGGTSNKKGTCKVTVKKAKITITPAAFQIPVGDTLKLGDTLLIDEKEVPYSVKTEPEGVELLWSSDNSNYAAVDRKTGEITGMTAGKTVDIVARGGGGEARCTVRIVRAKVADSIELGEINDPNPIVKVEGIRAVGVVYVVPKDTAEEDWSSKYCSWINITAGKESEEKKTDADRTPLRFQRGGSYIAVFVPDDTVNFDPIVSSRQIASPTQATTISGKLEFNEQESEAKINAQTNKPSWLEENSRVVFTGATLRDQFGNGIPVETSNVNEFVSRPETAFGTPVSWKADEDGKITIVVDVGGVLVGQELISFKLNGHLINIFAPSDGDHLWRAENLEGTVVVDQNG